MCTHLSKRGATYYFRRVVPEELRPFLDGRREWMISLRTKDRADAKRAIPPLTMTTDAALEAAREQLASTTPVTAPETPAQRKGRRAAYALREIELDAAELAAGPVLAKEARREDVAELEGFLRERLKGSTAAMPRKLRALAYIVKDAEFDRDVLREQLAIARSELARRDREGEAPSNATAVIAEPEVATVRASALPLIELFDAYASEQGMKAVTANEWRGNMRALVRYLGHDDAARITVEDIDGWRDFLLSEKTKRGGPRSARTVKDKYIAALRSTLNYAISKRKLTQNVAAMIDVRVPRKAKLRERDFTSDEAKAILSETIKEQDGVSVFMQRARRWIPWLCAYTGARVNEISQLRGGDVAQVDGIWTIRITPEAGTVKSGQARTVPLHPHLIEQGFPGVAEAVGEKPLFYDPGKVRAPGPGNRHVKKVGELLAAWVREAAGITDPNVQPNHGWRHLFKTRAGDAGMPERVADAIQGHAPRSVGQTYGRVSLQAMTAAVLKLPFFDIE